MERMLKMLFSRRSFAQSRAARELMTTCAAFGMETSRQRRCCAMACLRCFPGTSRGSLRPLWSSALVERCIF